MWHNWQSRIQRVIHLRFGLTNRKTTNCIARKTDFLQLDLATTALTEIETLTVNGREAATVALQQTTASGAQFSRLSLIIDPAQVVIVLGGALLDDSMQADRVLRQITRSVRFGPPPAQAGAYRGEDLDFAFNYPADWALNDSDPASLLLGPNEQALAASDFGTGGLLYVFSQQFSEARSAEEITTLFTSQFASLFTETQTLVELRPFTQNGNEAATLVQAGLLDGDPLLLTYTAVVRDNVSVLALALTPAERLGDFYPEHEAILNSLVINISE